MTPGRHPLEARRSGFTLIEVLLVLLIMSGILVTISQILTAARTSRDTIHNIRETQLAGPAILDLIENDVRALYAFNTDAPRVLRVRDGVVGGLDADRLDLITTTDSLVLTRDKANRFMRADVNEVGYCVRQNPDNNDFLELFRREAFGVDDAPFEGGYYTFLHDRIVSFDIRVFEEDGIDAEELESWGTDHDEFSGLPARIEIELALELAPRLMREQLTIAPIHARTVVHKRIIRLPQLLRETLQLRPLLAIPVVKPPSLEQESAGGAADAEERDGEGDEGDEVSPLTVDDPGTPSSDVLDIFGDG
jgi:prepilin-type N-terminal cleavage/methylation domain-containing protein